MKGLVTGLTPVLPTTETRYGVKDPTAQTAASALTMGKDLLSAIGIKSTDDLIAKAKQYGLTPEKFKEMLGIPINQTGSVKNEEDLTKQNPDDLYAIENPGGGVAPIIENPDDNFDVQIPEYDFANEYAKGGLIDLLHKMRSYK